MKTDKLEPKTFDSSIFSMKGISRKTIEEHLKLYAGYVNKYNEIKDCLAKLTEDDYAKANQVYSTIRELKTELSFAWGGVINHELYFGHLAGEGGKPKGKLMAQIEKDFGSYENFIKDLKATGMAARGWAWTAWNEKEKKLFNYLGDAQNSYLVWCTRPIIALDTYEHAYFADYGVNRAEYIDSFIINLDWGKIEKLFEGCFLKDADCSCGCDNC